jgi:hypothetical protein
MAPGTAGALDIADFLNLEVGKEWVVQGQGTYFGTPFLMTGYIQVREMVDPPVPGAVNLVVEIGSGYPIVLSMVQTLTLSMDGSHLYLHARQGEVWVNGMLNDLDEEVYLSPAEILPRHVYVGRDYPYTAELEGGPVEDVMWIEKTETVKTFESQEAEAVKVVFFVDDEVPVQLWMARNIGFMRVRISTDFQGHSLIANCVLTQWYDEWNPGPVHGLWCDTLKGPQGWRVCHWLGYVWPWGGIDSPYAVHYGFGLGYFMGSMDNMYMYVWNVGWFWSSQNVYPYFYRYAMGGEPDDHMIYIPGQGSYDFWSYRYSKYVDLTPGG